MLSTSGLTKQYGSKVAVDHINLHVEQGSFYGLIGPNGSGKTSTFGMLTGLLKPTSGEGMIASFPLKQMEKIKKKIGFLPQHAIPFAALTAREHLLFFSQLKHVSHTEEQCPSLIQQLGMSSYADTAVKKLSHGQSKMVGIAQAFLGSPELVILDEPMAGLDPATISMLRSFLQRQQQQKITILYSSHELAEVEKLCTHVGILKQGTLLKEGSLDALKAEANSLTLRVEKMVIPLIKSIERLPHVTAVSFMAPQLKIKYTGMEKITPHVIALLAKAGVQVYDIKEKSLEDLFLESV